MNEEVFHTQTKYIADHLNRKVIMVSGASGLVGSAIVRLLIHINLQYDANIKIVALYRDIQKLNEAIGSDKTNVIPIKWDIEQESLHYEGKVDAVIHCAGVSGGSKMKLQEPVRLFDINVNSTRSLLDYCVHHGASFIFASSYEIYGILSQEDSFNEDAPSYLDTFTVRNIYAECKRMCESLCCAYSSQFGINAFAVRLTSTFGQGVLYNDPRFFAEFARCIVEKRNIILKSKGETVRSYLDVDDAAMAMLFVLTDGKSSNVYNLTNMANAISIKDIAERMIALSGADIQIMFDIADNVEKLGYRKESRTLMDATKLEQLGWKPIYSLEDTLIRLINSFKKHSYK